LPPFGKVDLVIERIRITNVNKRQILKDQPDIRYARRPGTQLKKLKITFVGIC